MAFLELRECEGLCFSIPPWNLHVQDPRCTCSEKRRGHGVPYCFRTHKLVKGAKIIEGKCEIELFNENSLKFGAAVCN